MQQASTSGRRNAQDTTGDEHPATLSLDDRLAPGERRSAGSRRDVTQEVSSARAQQVGTQDIAADADAMGRAEQRGRRNSTARNEKALQRRISKLEAALTGEGVEGSSSFNGGEGGEGEGEYMPPPCLVYDARSVPSSTSPKALRSDTELDAIARLGLVGFRAPPDGAAGGGAARRRAQGARQVHRCDLRLWVLSAPTAAGAAAAAEAEAEAEGGAMHDEWRREPRELEIVQAVARGAGRRGRRRVRDQGGGARDVCA